MNTTTERRKAMRALLAGSDMVVVPEAPNAAVGRLVEDAGYKMAYVSGSAQSLLQYAVPDYGLVTITDMLCAASRIAGELTIPVLVDVDQGGETYLNIRRTIQTFEQTAVAGLHIEDSANPKHVGGASPPLLSIEQMVGRVRAAADARRDSDFVLVVRSDLGYNAARGSGGGAPFSVQEAIDRGCAYAEAGADAYFCCLTPPDALQAVARGVPIPLIDINHPVPQASQTGLRLDVFSGALGPAFLATAERLLSKLTQEGFVDRLEVGPSPGVRDRIQRIPEYAALARSWSQR